YVPEAAPGGTAMLMLKGRASLTASSTSASPCRKNQAAASGCSVRTWALAVMGRDSAFVTVNVAIALPPASRATLLAAAVITKGPGVDVTSGPHRDDVALAGPRYVALGDALRVCRGPATGHVFVQRADEMEYPAERRQVQAMTRFVLDM